MLAVPESGTACPRAGQSLLRPRPRARARPRTCTGWAMPMQNLV